jgi:hypothetical protein
LYFSFWTRLGRVRITCDLDYARWLVNTGRVAMGVWDGPGNRIYL